MKKVSIITLSFVMLINSGVVFSANKKRIVKITSNKSPIITSSTTVNETEEQNTSEEITIQSKKSKYSTQIEKLLSSIQLNIETAKNSCSDIKDDLKAIQVLAGVSTGASSLGTLTSGGALVTGIIKAKTDKEIEENQAKDDSIRKLLNMSDREFEQAILSGEVSRVLSETSPNVTRDNLNEKQTALQKEIADETKKSKTLGNVRTGLLAGSIATSATSTITSGISIKKLDDLISKMKSCDKAVENVKAQTSFVKSELEEDENISNNSTLSKADEIVKSCSGFDTSNIKDIKGVMTASTVVGGIGAATSIAGTVTSALANSKNVRNDNSEDGVKKEKGLNLASNIMAGITTGTSAGGIVLGAVSLNKLAKNVDTAEKCEDALK